MLLKIVITLTLIFNCYKSVESYEYGTQLRDEEIFSPCNRSDAYFIERYLDMSDMHFQFLPNGSVYVHGSLTWIRDFTTDIIGQDKVILHLYKKKRNTWVNTIYNIERLDACTTLFNPTELWQKYTVLFPQESRKCPFFKGQKLIFDTIGDFGMNVPDPHVEGDYMLNIMIQFKSLNELFCTNIFGEVFRI